ncbi:MAG: hypothetical protein DWQ01_18900 [Planctomycetota bacterium]|nr:MAG: hypothetical protein DWQ01_18900 [Planctomycetota bacterium]
MTLARLWLWPGVLALFMPAVSAQETPPPVPQDPPRQEEEDQQPPGETPAPEGEEGQTPEEEGGLSPEEATAEMMRLVDEVRDGFRRVDQTLQLTRDEVDKLFGGAIDRPEPPPIEGEGEEGEEGEAPVEDIASVEDGLSRAMNEAEDLVATMEELLSKIPEQSNQNSSSSSSSNRNDRPPPPQNQDQPHDDQENPSPKPESVAPPPEGVQQMILFDPRIGAWGALPPRLQESLQNATAEDLPLRYRRWLDEYHRRSVPEGQR